jgi:beta-galactosidase GanA
LRIKALGLNAVQFYLPWNLIEADEEKSYLQFIQLCAKMDLFIILRLGPYVCGEIKEAINTPFCPSQEKFHTDVLRGFRNISEAP